MTEQELIAAIQQAKTPDEVTRLFPLPEPTGRPMTEFLSILGEWLRGFYPPGRLPALASIRGGGGGSMTFVATTLSCCWPGCTRSGWSTMAHLDFVPGPEVDEHYCGEHYHDRWQQLRHHRAA